MVKRTLFLFVFIIGVSFAFASSVASTAGEHDYWVSYITDSTGLEASISFSEEETRKTYLDMLYDDYKNSFSEDEFWNLIRDTVLYSGSEYISIDFTDHSISCRGMNAANEYTEAYWNLLSEETLYKFADVFIEAVSTNKNLKYWNEIVLYISYRKDMDLFYYQGEWLEGDIAVSNPQLVIEGWKSTNSSFDYKRFFSDLMWKMTKEEADAFLVQSGLERHKRFDYNLSNPHKGANDYDVVQIGYTGYYAFGAYSNMINVYYNLNGKPVEAYVAYYSAENFGAVFNELQTTYGTYDKEGYKDWKGAYDNEEFYLWDEGGFKVILLSQDGAIELAENGEGSFCIYFFYELPKDFVVK